MRSRFECASCGSGLSKHTHSHHHEESSQESAQFHNTAASRIHEVIVRLRFAAYPVGHGRKHVGCDHEQGKEVVVEGGGEDDEDEADGEDLVEQCQYRVAIASSCGEAYEGQDDDGLDAGHGCGWLRRGCWVDGRWVWFPRRCTASIGNRMRSRGRTAMVSLKQW